MERSCSNNVSGPDSQPGQWSTHASGLSWWRARLRNESSTAGAPAPRRDGCHLATSAADISPSVPTQLADRIGEREAGNDDLALFSKWSPPAGMEVKSFYARADGKGGTVLVETDDVKALLDGPSKFGAVNEFEIVPGIDIGEGVPILSDAVAWMESIS